MTGFNIKIEVNEEARTSLAALLDRMANPRPFLSIRAHRITIQARPFLGLSSKDEADIFDLARGWLAIG